jgi:hypothetical protein
MNAKALHDVIAEVAKVLLCTLTGLRAIISSFVTHSQISASITVKICLKTCTFWYTFKA